MKRLFKSMSVLIMGCLLAVNVYATNPTNEVATITEEASQGTTVEEKIFGKINATNVIMRTGTTRETEKICSLSKGVAVEIVPGSEVENTDEFGNRIKIIYQEKEGYIAKKYVTQIENLQAEWYLLSTATTQADANQNRDTNISIASNYINGTILKPGEKFSFWDTVGKCTYDKGYKDATVYNAGKVSTGIGGGICQVSTTVNISAKNAGIKTNARQHSLPVSYASREDEATVSYGNVDFSFTNTTGKTLKIVMYSGDGACTCEIWATDKCRGIIN